MIPCGHTVCCEEMLLVPDLTGRRLNSFAVDPHNVMKTTQETAVEVI